MHAGGAKDLGLGLRFLSEMDLAQGNPHLGPILGFGGLEAGVSYGWKKDTNV